MFEVAIQVTIGAKIASKGNDKRNEKNVIAKCYYGDISRKENFEKQKEGKRMAAGRFGGNSQEAFHAVLSLD
ncbi:MAG: hypothetical protein IPI04_08980 [Ignavibacteria bacterium]|nr:hypothetical protein [Ignavibacteria bacterium]